MAYKNQNKKEKEEGEKNDKTEMIENPLKIEFTNKKFLFKINLIIIKKDNQKLFQI